MESGFIWIAVGLGVWQEPFCLFTCSSYGVAEITFLCIFTLFKNGAKKNNVCVYVC